MTEPLPSTKFVFDLRHAAPDLQNNVFEKSLARLLSGEISVTDDHEAVPPDVLIGSLNQCLGPLERVRLQHFLINFSRETFEKPLAEIPAALVRNLFAASHFIPGQSVPAVLTERAEEAAAAAEKITASNRLQFLTAAYHALHHAHKFTTVKEWEALAEKGGNLPQLLPTVTVGIMEIDPVAGFDFLLKESSKLDIQWMYPVHLFQAMSGLLVEKLTRAQFMKVYEARQERLSANLKIAIETVIRGADHEGSWNQPKPAREAPAWHCRIA